MNSYAVNLESFEGTLDLLLHLLQRKEIELSKIELTQITHPFLDSFEKKPAESQFDLGVEFIQLASQIALMKSRYLLPRNLSGDALQNDLEEDPKFDIIHHLIDYCRFKEAAHLFSDIEIKQEGLYPRGVKGGESKKPLGLEGISLSELESLFQEMLKKAQPATGKIEEEEYRVQDKIVYLRKVLKTEGEVSFASLFEAAGSKMEMIVIFLALLELIKLGELKVQKQEGEIVLYGQRD